MASSSQRGNGGNRNSGSRNSASRNGSSRSAGGRDEYREPRRGVTNMTNPAVPAAVMATEGIPMEEAAVPKEKSPCPKRGRPEREEGSLCLQWKWSLLLCWQLFSGRC